MKVKSESEVAQSCPTLVTPWTADYQAPPSMGFSRQKYWNGVPLPSTAPNIGALHYIRQALTDIKGEADSNTKIVGDFDTLFTPVDRSSKQKISKETCVK